MQLPKLFSLNIKILLILSLFALDINDAVKPATDYLFSKKDKNIKSHFSKMTFIEQNEFTLGMTSSYEVSKSDSTLFASSILSWAKVKAFYLSATEVTNKEWRTFYNDSAKEIGVRKAKEIYYPDTSIWSKDYPYGYNGPLEKNYFSNPKYNDFPVIGITWTQAVSYCNWKSKKVNALLKNKNIDTEIEFRLPTHKEWESAALIKTSAVTERTLYCWEEKNMLQRINSLSNLGMIYDENRVALKNHSDDGHYKTSKVASYPPNSSGIYDMGGNVSEWTSVNGFVSSTTKESKTDSLFTSEQINEEIEYLKSKPIKTNDDKFSKEVTELFIKKLKHDQRLLSKGDIKICKGGNWDSGLIYAQHGSKQGYNKDTASSKVGLRIAMSDIPEQLKKYMPKSKWKPKK